MPLPVAQGDRGYAMPVYQGKIHCACHNSSIGGGGIVGVKYLVLLQELLERVSRLDAFPPHSVNADLQYCGLLLLSRLLRLQSALSWMRAKNP